MYCRAGNKGHAYTFVTPENAKYAGEIIRALELSGAEASPELAELWTSYKAEQEAEGKKIKSGGGFSGTKGYKFDEAESQMASEKKKFQKHVLGESLISNAVSLQQKLQFLMCRAGRFG